MFKVVREFVIKFYRGVCFRILISLFVFGRCGVMMVCLGFLQVELYTKVLLGPFVLIMVLLMGLV